uniref:TsaA-like domain-containing protein n=1 Tax=Chromera velia CCMP2878 TaxID=1169474 RepID=A0A0G4HQH0_9ALVE|eukprot:Cvel_7940.t1-p1 / transcript=Cvel_7940.t1 / gene=Cvel_7940 / organism=Chromera_velia_CCMP2878 / gene_product=Putative S-adenosylmethionine-dependent, putative / transcript_product=Putative S-adenosylmethionine-dependent, putative / location=Cvel_scaffold426:44260-49391(+) / protein_length=590 / sequence_SO=supercontig / SO=protein_coding / is_pseudo=false
MSERSDSAWMFEQEGVFRGCYKEKWGTPRQGPLAPTSFGEVVFHSPDQAKMSELVERGSAVIVFVFHLDLLPPRRQAKGKGEPHLAPLNSSGIDSANSNLKPPKGSLGSIGVASSSSASSSTALRSFKSKVTPPKMGGKRTGVFGTRSPHRPNPIGLTVCRVEGRGTTGESLMVSGVDLVDGSPVLYMAAFNLGAVALGTSLKFPSWLPLPSPLVQEKRKGREEGHTALRQVHGIVDGTSGHSQRKGRRETENDESRLPVFFSLSAFASLHLWIRRGKGKGKCLNGEELLTDVKFCTDRETGFGEETEQRKPQGDGEEGEFGSGTETGEPDRVRGKEGEKETEEAERVMSLVRETLGEDPRSLFSLKRDTAGRTGGVYGTELAGFEVVYAIVTGESPSSEPGGCTEILQSGGSAERSEKGLGGAKDGASGDALKRSSSCVQNLDSTSRSHSAFVRVLKLRPICAELDNERESDQRTDSAAQGKRQNLLPAEAQECEKETHFSVASGHGLCDESREDVSKEERDGQRETVSEELEIGKDQRMSVEKRAGERKEITGDSAGTQRVKQGGRNFRTAAWLLRIKKEIPAHLLPF